MIKLSPDICLKIKSARRLQRLSQSEVALEVGCKQSALSMFEQGQPTKLSEAVVRKLAEKFGIDLCEKRTDEGLVARVEALAPATGFCPNPHCPSNHAYAVDGCERLLPDRQSADPVGGRFCALCGEVLERRCPTCSELVHAGAICSFCGSPYIAI